VIGTSQLRSLLYFLKDFKSSPKDTNIKWAKKEDQTEHCLSQWYDEVVKDVEGGIERLKKKRRRRRKMILRDTNVKHDLEDMQKRFVFVPTDKASSNIAVVCKKFYIEQSLRELDIFKESNLNDKAKTYVQVTDEKKCIRTSTIKRHLRYMKTSFSIDEIPEDIPFLYWIPKMHKKPKSKQRYIAASNRCSTKPLSAILTKCLKLVETQHRRKCKWYKTCHGINPMWSFIIQPLHMRRSSHPIGRESVKIFALMISLLFILRFHIDS
jgi:hypothetical protein